MSNFVAFLFFLSIAVVGLDIQDDMGRHEVGFLENTHKDPIDNGQGCRFYSSFTINKVSMTIKRLHFKICMGSDQLQIHCMFLNS